MAATTRDQTLAAALAAHRAGDLAAAAAGYGALLERHAGDLDALHLLGVLHHHAGRYDQALDLADAFIAAAPHIADAHLDQGNALAGLEHHQSAAEAFRLALDLAPDLAAAAFNLGNALRGAQDADGAVAAYRRAVGLAPDLAPAWSNLGATLAELGLPDDAADACRRALRAAPEYADAHYNLGNALREGGHAADAALAFEHAIELAPDHADALCNLGLVRFADGPDTAAETLSRAITVDHNHALARFYLGVALEEAGRQADADAAFSALDPTDPTDGARLDSWEFVKATRTAETAMLADGFQLLAHAVDRAPAEGLMLEFGVRHGTSIRHLAALVAGPLDGFDSFEGLPQAWGDEPAGVYSTGGRMPDVPANVRLHAGLFEDTLGPFLDANPGPVRLAHIDCDIHASTAVVLAGLASRLVAGSVLVFDDYLVNPTWREDEHRAFVEAAAEHGWSHDTIAYSIVGKQMAVRVR